MDDREKQDLLALVDELLDDTPKGRACRELIEAMPTDEEVVRSLEVDPPLRAR